MSKLWTIFKREYVTRLKTKGFIIGTALNPVFIILMLFGPGLLMSLKSEKSDKISVVDPSGIVYDELVNTLDDTTSNGKRVYDFSKREASDEKLDAVQRDLSKSIDKIEIDGYFIISPDIIERNEIQFYSKSVSDFDENRIFRNFISQIITNHRLKESNLDPALICKLTERNCLRTFKVAKGGREVEDRGSHSWSHLLW